MSDQTRRLEACRGPASGSSAKAARMDVRAMMTRLSVARASVSISSAMPPRSGTRSEFEKANFVKTRGFHFIG